MKASGLKALNRAVSVLRPFAAGRLSETGYTSSPAREKMSMLAASMACSVASTVRGSWPSTRRMVGSTCGARAPLGAAPGVALGEALGPAPGPGAACALWGAADADAGAAPPDNPVLAVPSVPPGAVVAPPTALP